jgi:hypothetical protein
MTSSMPRAERCSTVITAMQETRRLPDGHWVHKICPAHPS